MGLRTAKGLRLSPFFYLWTSLFFLISVILLMWTVFENVPIWNTHTTSVDHMGFPAWLFQVNETTSAKPEKGTDGLKQYGFGVWGWCEWGDSPAAVTDFADCTSKAFWSIPGDGKPGDTVRALHLPE